ncbi:hypothetical protein EB836_04365 [Brevibacterium sp. S111]|nr:hypothetical protein EB836_04365 [Brevibacterium sp. S111]
MVNVFGLPTATVVIIFGIPAIWVIYTLVFVVLSRGWKAEDVAEDAALANTRASAKGGSATDGGAASAGENGGLA